MNKILFPELKNENEKKILSPEALNFLKDLFNEFNGKIKNLLKLRVQDAKLISDGQLPNFLEETEGIRNSTWQISSVPKDLQDRRVEITGPVGRKIIINALNSGANVFMADFEDSNSPTWKNTLDGQINLFDAVREEISLFDKVKNKEYKLNKDHATLMVRPRGLHLLEKNILIEDEPIHGSLVDFGLYFFHNAQELLDKGSGPYFYLPKIEHFREAALWNEVFNFSQDKLNIKRGTIKATVLIETLPAAFQMNEILYQLKDHSAGLNCGRWDYIFSFIKTLKDHEQFTLPNRSDLTMDKHFMRSYTQLLIQTCHKRKAHAMGGMSAFIPIKNDEMANNAALDAVKKDKMREVKDGHDGTWVAHPGLVEMTRKIFDEYMPTKNQINNKREDVSITANDLLQTPQGERTEDDIRKNINVSLQYINSWLSGTGCVPINNLMEDAATVEISRALIWQWIKFKVKTDSGIIVSKEKIQKLLLDEVAKLKTDKNIEENNETFKKAIEIFSNVSMNTSNFNNFLTTDAYEELIKISQT